MARQRWGTGALAKKTKKGFRGYPVATVAFYGPNDNMASKVVAAIVDREGADPVAMEKWFSDSTDLRYCRETGEEVLAFVTKHGAHTVVAGDRIIGCPHEEGVDYPEGQWCPECPFWIGRDRFTGEVLH